ncbi:hypothetical protein [Sporolactobacillus nakayamae]|uniref:Transmembrane Fragile-X-F protein n=1 Tax=Sporolactobacillus nakayamae TaxID=269670 RepID=A0A1I2P3S4_9BACL|nr:hypothetical protein [Sporolactobacillus nakayamae]SFG10183.1 hypothetical protein SAMN02982927_00677 [Sporolactobacillus nakayamae]
MGFLEVLTIIFVICKLIGVLSWSWWIVLLPEIIAVAIYIIWFGVFGLIFGRTKRKIDKAFDDDFFKKW